MSNEMNTPWELFPISNTRSHIKNALGQLEFRAVPNYQAKDIVKCVNSHDALVEALEKMVDTFYCSIEPATSLDGCYTNDPHEITARAALTAASSGR